MILKNLFMWKMSKADKLRAKAEIADAREWRDHYRSEAKRDPSKSNQKYLKDAEKEHDHYKKKHEPLLHPIKHKAKVVAKVAVGTALAGGAAYGGYKLYQKYGKKK
jgi:F0F1-type ATP synthase membrane subunit b/b'